MGFKESSADADVQVFGNALKQLVQKSFDVAKAPCMEHFFRDVNFTKWDDATLVDLLSFVFAACSANRFSILRKYLVLMLKTASTLVLAVRPLASDDALIACVLQILLIASWGTSSFASHDFLNGICENLFHIS